LKRLLRSDDRAITAVHEAGHCLAHIHYGQTFDDVQLAGDSHVMFNRRFNREVVERGVVTRCYDGTMFPRSFYEELGPYAIEYQLREAEAELACSYAGPIAQARFVRHGGLWGAIFDGGRGDMKHMGRVLSHWWPDSRTEQCKSERDAERRARRLVHSRQGWQVIRSIAEQLYQRNILEFEECFAAYMQVYGREPVPLFYRQSLAPECLEEREAA
jgi:hypothetical protein